MEVACLFTEAIYSGQLSCSKVTPPESNNDRIEHPEHNGVSTIVDRDEHVANHGESSPQPMNLIWTTCTNVAGSTNASMVLCQFGGYCDPTSPDRVCH